MPAGGTAGVVEEPVDGGICAKAADDTATRATAHATLSFIGTLRICPGINAVGLETFPHARTIIRPLAGATDRSFKAFVS